METKQELLTLNGKEYLLDIEQAEKLGLLKEKDNRVKSWDEFKEKYCNNIGYVYIEELKFPQTTSIPFYVGDQLTSHEAKAIAAFSKLIRLRRDWIGEWEPQYNDSNYFIFYNNYTKAFLIDWFNHNSRSLNFPTRQMAEEFLETFRDLIEEAKILI